MVVPKSDEITGYQLRRKEGDRVDTPEREASYDHQRVRDAEDYRSTRAGWKTGEDGIW